MRKLLYLSILLIGYGCSSSKAPTLVNAHKDPNQKEISRKLNISNHKKTKEGVYTFY